MVSQVLILNGFVAGDLFGMTFRWPQENLNCEPLNLPNPLSILRGRGMKFKPYCGHQCVIENTSPVVTPDKRIKIIWIFLKLLLSSK